MNKGAAYWKKVAQRFSNKNYYEEPAYKAMIVRLSLEASYIMALGLKKSA